MMGGGCEGGVKDEEMGVVGKYGGEGGRVRV